MISLTVAPELINLFQQQAQQKLLSEGWLGRNIETKVKNFVNCWITEEAFKQLLIGRRIRFRHRGLYFGDAQGAGPDFTVWRDGKEITLGLRCIGKDSVTKWQEVTYPDDRFRNEKEKIADYHVACTQQEGVVHFLGIISKENLLQELEKSRVAYSRKNQEKFRVIPLKAFSESTLISFLISLESI